MSMVNHSIQYCKQTNTAGTRLNIATTDDHTLLVRQRYETSMCLVYAKTPLDQICDWSYENNKFSTLSPPTTTKRQTDHHTSWTQTACTNARYTALLISARLNFQSNHTASARATSKANVHCLLELNWSANLHVRTKSSV